MDPYLQKQFPEWENYLEEDVEGDDDEYYVDQEGDDGTIVVVVIKIALDHYIIVPDVKICGTGKSI